VEDHAEDIKDLREIRKRIDGLPADGYVELLLNVDMALDILNKHRYYSDAIDGARDLLTYAKMRLQPSHEHWNPRIPASTAEQEKFIHLQAICTGVVGAALFGFGDFDFMDEE
jgi:hypothetical protein